MKRGFTIIEIMVAITIFIVVMTISMGAILNVFSANAKSQSVKVAFDNLNSALETMSREMRFGTKWHCEDLGALAPTSDISTQRACFSFGSFVSFLSSENEQITYRLNGTTLEKAVSTAGTAPASSAYIPVTSNEIVITKLWMLVYRLGIGYQPWGYFLVKGYAGSKASTRTDFSIQTLVSQRAPAY
ncbi:type II secretion system GspH family protein [Candidatus Parcubacteria bacterium]|nr:type II secretion system GspH family protein [Candidatus Parcubacteria bacterium]